VETIARNTHVEDAMTFQLKGNPRCPKCNALLDGGCGLNNHGAEPAPGDVTICVYCGSLNCFKDDLQLRTMTFKQRIELPEPIQRAVNEAMQALREYKMLNPNEIVYKEPDHGSNQEAS
jgi:hypothetical protein